MDYLASGRTTAGLATVDTKDSDGDGAGNSAEIADGKYSGDPASRTPS